MQEQEVEEFTIKRKPKRMHIITCGSSAAIHVLSNTIAKSPDILFNNEFTLIETSEAQLINAIDVLTETYRKYYSIKVGRKPEKFKGFPVSTFYHKLKQNAILINRAGGAAKPEEGLRYYNENREMLLRRLLTTFYDNDCCGIIILGCSGKGTGTLVTPALISDLSKISDLPHPIGFITLPFRFRRPDTVNASKTISFIVDNSVPCFLLDYEHALYIFLYMTEERPKHPTDKVVYGAVTQCLARVLSTFIQTLNHGDKTSPPMDYSDVITQFELKGTVGTIAYSYRTRLEEFLSKWQSDLDNLLLLRTRRKPDKTNVVTILRSAAGIPLEVEEKLSDYYTKNWNSLPLMYTLEKGEGYTIASLIYGLDPLDIDPPLKYKPLKWSERLKKAIMGV